MKEKPVVLITGASHGIGRACAEKFAQMGYRLALAGAHDEKALQELSRRLETECFYRLTDVSDAGQAELLCKETFERYKRIDCLVNNAGISYVGLLTDMRVEEWDELLRTNLSSLFYMCRAVVPDMVRRKQGRIINLSSVWGAVGASCEVAYSASKGGINAFTKALAKELAPSNIQVNAVAPGAVETRMNAFLDVTEREQLIEEIPAGRLAEPEEIAELVYSLATAGSYLTGQIVTVDGGWI